MNLIDYIVEKWNQEGEAVDKVKVNLLAIFNTALFTILSVKGFMSFFDLKYDSVLVYITLMGWGYTNFRMYRLWHIGHIIRGLESPSNDK